MDNEDQSPEDRVEPWVEIPGLAELVMAEKLLRRIEFLKQTHGRIWAIAATEAEKLLAWISYATHAFDPDNSKSDDTLESPDSKYCACPVPWLPIGGWGCERCGKTVQSLEGKTTSEMLYGVKS